MKFLAMIALFPLMASADVVTEMAEQNPEATPYEILETLYTSSTTPAQLSDFPRFGTETTIECAGVSEKKKSEVFKQVAVPMVDEATIAESTESHGPLFPGRPARTKMGLVFSSIGTPFMGPGPRASMIQIQTLTTVENDLVLSVSEAPTGFEAYAFPVSVYFRMTQGYLVYKAFLRTAKGEPLTMMTYCWKN